MIIALASPRIASSIEEGLDKIKQLLSEAAAQGAEIGHSEFQNELGHHEQGRRDR
jgi:hypothetical protein